MKQAGMTSHTERNGVNKQGEAQIEKNWMTRERTKEQKAKPEETGNQRSDNAKNTPPILELNHLQLKKYSIFWILERDTIIRLQFH